MVRANTMTRPRILHLLGTAHVEGTGIARIVAAIASGLDPARYKVDAWFLGDEGPLCDMLGKAGADVRTVRWSGGANDPAGVWRMARALSSADVAVFHQHVGGRAPRRLAKWICGASVVTHVHGYVTEVAGASPEPRTIDDADLVIAVSCAVAEHVQARGVRMVHTGVAARAAAASGGVTGAGTIVGTACRLVPIKGVVHLVRAIGLIRGEFPGLRLEVAGSGPARAELEQETRRLGLDDCVTFLGWCADLDHAFNRWTVFVLPSLAEGLGISALEAMAAGLPVIASDVGGLREAVTGGVSGLLAPAGDPTALAACLRQVLSDSSLRQRLASAGQERARAAFSERQMIDEIDAIYETLLQRRDAPSRC